MIETSKFQKVAFFEIHVPLFINIGINIELKFTKANLEV